MSLSEHERRSGYANEPPFAFRRGFGSCIEDSAGRTYIDLTSGWNVVNAGWSNPVIGENWLDTIGRATFRPSWCEDEGTANLRQALARAAPGRTPIFSCSGSEAIDNAIKIARIVTGLPGIFCIEGSYHGSGTGASQATGYDVPHRAPLAQEEMSVRLPLPTEEGAVERAEALIREFEPGGAIVYETVVTNMGCRTMPADYLAMLGRVADELGIVLICDEIGTGINRLGALFSSLGEGGLAPDIIVSGKALTNGLYPMSACLVKDRMMRHFETGQFASTYAAMPAGCAAALATLSLHEQTMLGTTALANGRTLAVLAEKHLLDIDGVTALAGAGMERALHLDWRILSARGLGPYSMLSALREAGVFATLSPGESHLMMTPPLTIGEEQLAQATGAIAATLKDPG
ncbi:aminotransferase class III-fold pyridoxal phosphate-dependent enzyme [Croceicoccus marinus]|jgi:4-aminobutyrate aminotransferase-like enzyme|uniref:Aminotransferase class III-fold pyridoxal phosphate-dependent enzyme n=1 Tax=Croceicoccus marinus TaxID=450378 RepID=A0A7G6VZI7_9SPHN|nr:aminotransferase class III-fold pyridoxal phosphate-dependent enzyme [Croceicoccus marinus]QNE07152.1 aminotransferase class III-fold pyridoxal phosphate-dependent enzyme [Croceicoccus marinus]